MNREPSTTIKPTNNASGCALPSKNREAWKNMFLAAREAFGPQLQGLHCREGDRAFFVKNGGDKTWYSIKIDEVEQSLFIGGE